MKRMLLIVVFGLLATATITVHKSSVSNAQDKKVQDVPIAPPASSEVVDSIIAKDAYQYAVSIRPTTGEENLQIGDPTLESPRYCGQANIGVESYLGIPRKTEVAYDTELPCSLYFKIKVISIADDIAQVKLTVGNTTDVEKTKGIATWNEKVWTVDREVRLDETDTVQLTAPTGKTVPNFEVRYRVRKFDGKLE